MKASLILTMALWAAATLARAEGSGLTEGPVASAACNDLCRGVGDSAEGMGLGRAGELAWAACFSCRCKESLGWLPSPEELRCSTGTHLTRYRARTEGHGADGRPRVVGVDVIDPDGTSTDGCLNGGIAAAGCDLQSRFKRITRDHLEFQLLCRKPTVEDQGYYEYLVIGNNTRTGATCFWQARSHTFDGEAVPSLDVTDAQRRPIPAAVARYTDTFYLYSAGPSSCTSCHAADAFIWSPYFHSAYPLPLGDPLVLARLTGPYFKVSAASERLQPVGNRFLVEGPATPNAPPTTVGCTGCHRVADGSWCSSMSWQALGHSYRAGSENLDQPSAFDYARRLVFWMPPSGTDHAGWLRRADADQHRIRACCVEGSHASCRWSDEF